MRFQDAILKVNYGYLGPLIMQPCANSNIGTTLPYVNNIRHRIHFVKSIQLSHFIFKPDPKPFLSILTSTQTLVLYTGLFLELFFSTSGGVYEELHISSADWLDILVPLA